MENERRRFIRREASLFREKCRLSRYGIIDLFKECERLEYKLIRYPLGENTDLGFALKRDNDTIIFTNSSSRLSREIFTLAHEIGHIVLHFSSNNSFIDNDVTIAEKSVDEKEKEANYFAACLLMPSDVVEKFIDFEMSNIEKNGISALDIAKIMSNFNVSFDMVLNRLQGLGIIDYNQKICLDCEKTEKKVGNLLHSVGGNARLNVASNEIYIPYTYMEYVIYNYNHNAIPKETLEKVLECYNLTIDDISDELVEHSEEDDENIEDLLGGLLD